MDNGDQEENALIAAEQLLSLSAGVGLASSGLSRRLITQEIRTTTIVAYTHLPTSASHVQRQQLEQLENKSNKLRAFRMNDRLKDYTTQLNTDGLIDLSMKRDKPDEHLSKINAPRTVSPVEDKKSIKHKLPVLPPPEKDNFKIKKTIEKRNSIVQTDEVNLVTEKEQEILHFIKINAITMASLTRLVEKKDDVNNNTEKKHTKHAETYKQPETAIVLDNKEEIKPKVAEEIESIARKNSENNKNMIFKVFESLHNANEKIKSEQESFNAILAKIEKNHKELMTAFESIIKTMFSNKHNDVKETQTDLIPFPKDVFQNISTQGKPNTKRRQEQNQMMRNQFMQVHQQTSNHQDYHHPHDTHQGHQHRVEETQQPNGHTAFYGQNGNHYERQPWLLQQLEYQQRQIQFQETGIHHAVHQPQTIPRNPVQAFQDIELRRVGMDRTNNYPNSAWTK